MSRKITASDRKSLIRLASSLPQGSDERRAILAGLKKVGDAWAGATGFQVGRIEEYEGDWVLLVSTFNGNDEVYASLITEDEEGVQDWKKPLDSGYITAAEILEWQKTYTRILKQVSRGASPEKFGFKQQ